MSDTEARGQESSGTRGGVRGVMVSYDHSGPEQHAGIVTVSASGIRFSRRWVLTHGSLLSPLDMARDIHNARGKPILNERFYDSLPEMYITCEPSGEQRRAHEQLAQLSRSRAGADQQLQQPAYQMVVLTGRVVHVWQCELLARCVTELLYSWSIGQRKQQQERDEELGRTLLSVLVLVDLEAPHADDKVRLLRPLSELWDLVRAAPAPARGSPLLVHSTPFGCEALLNSETRGAVCAVIGSRPSLLLTDASTALGSEGAPVFAPSQTDRECGLVGVVACSVSWWRGEWVGLTLVAPLSPMLAAKLRIPVQASPPAQLGDSTLQHALRCIDLTTVLVRCGGTWGSGVHLGQGYVLTCAHVVHQHASEKLSVYCAGVRAAAILRYKTRDELAYDLALLYTNPHSWTHLMPAIFPDTLPAKGESVVAAGYPYFSEKNISDVKPTITSGYISNVSPSMIQTSCCVQSGFSGGAIYRVRREMKDDVRVECVGIIVSNAKTQQSNACYPYINMAVPHNVWKAKVIDFLQHKDETSLRELESKQELIQAQWRLLPYRSKI